MNISPARAAFLHGPWPGPLKEMLDATEVKSDVEEVEALSTEDDRTVQRG